ncbi:hypothetical protein RSA46_24070 [Pseudomonas oryzihabitans]|nr:hypothetical protein RSA46_24070 [Pseudomonas psychrotolerans]
MVARAYWPLYKDFPEGIRTFKVLVFKGLLKFGSWMTVSNIISPLMVYFDRFVLSGMVGAHGGRVSVDDGLDGRGTTMRMHLPLPAPPAE